MGTTHLRQFLMSLCNNSHWKYAVFWKLMHQNPLVLTWEDGYCDKATPAETFESASDEIYIDGAKRISFSSCETSIRDIGSGGCPIGLAVANMSGLQYALGEGLVGEVAYTGTHTWVCINDFFSRDFESKLVSNWTDEWLIQIALGIKTILLVPVLPDGVLQLGSLETVAEEQAAVGLVKDRFDAYRNMMDEIMPFTLMRNILAHSSSTPLSSTIENLNEPKGLIINQLKAEKLDDVDSKRMKLRRLSTPKQSVPPQTAQDVLLGAGKDAPYTCETTIEDEICFPEDSTLPSQSVNSSSTDMVDTKMFGLPCLEEELLAYSLSNGYNTELFGESLRGVDPYSAEDMAAQLFGDNPINDGSYKSMDSFYRFPEDCELHKALGPSFQEKTYEQNSSVLIKDACDNKYGKLCNKDLMHVIEPSRFAGGSDAENMLEAVVANLCSISDDALSSASDTVRSCTTSSRQPSTFFQPQVQSKAVPVIGNCAVKHNLAVPTFLARVGSSASPDGMMSTLIDEGKQAKGYGHAQSTRGKKLTNVKTSRMRNGNNQRQRPRDRQLIQDRLKELRELVPNGAKFSIDGLLDRTIKHMLYLRSVADQAEKLKGYPKEEVASCKNLKSSESNYLQNGTSWAFELGSELQACPIVVKDLEYTGHMLIEVLCDEHGLFLEIAQLIRRLNLTILKGSMESRSSNTWAYFVVEANKGFHRMEIFWPLLHLLQRARNRISSKI